MKKYYFSGFIQIFLALLVAVIGIGAIGYFAYKNGQIKVPSQNISNAPSPTTTATELIENNNTLTPQPLKKVSIPSNWKSFTDQDFEFKTRVTLSLPPGYSFRFSGSEWTIMSDNADEIWDYRNSMFSGDSGLKNYYDGSSRRSWYQRFLNDEFSANTIKSAKATITSVTEHFFNSTSYLEIATKNSNGDTEKQYVFVENGLLHVIKASSGNISLSKIPDAVDILFSSLKSEILK